MYERREDWVRGSDMRAQTRMASWPFRGREDHDTGPSFLGGEGTRVSCESVVCVREAMFESWENSTSRYGFNCFLGFLVRVVEKSI